MAYRKSMSRGKSKRQFKRATASKKINHVSRMGSRGGIRL